MRRRLAGTVAALLALVPLCVLADDKDDALKIARRAASLQGNQEVKVILHATPPSLPSIPLPKATLLGSIVTTPQLRNNPIGRSATVAASASRPAELYYETATRDATLKAYEETLRAAGWKGIDWAQRLPFAQGGFAQEFPHYEMWCSPATPPVALMIGTPTFDPTALNLNVIVDASGRESVCAAQGNSVTAWMETFRKLSPLPTFTASDGITIDNGGPASDGSTTGARITSALGIAAVFESFAKQLRDAGWTPQGSAGATGLRSQTFAKTVDGTPYVALLTIYPLDATHYVALADVSNAR